MITLLQTIDIMLFATLAYHIMHLSPRLEKAHFSSAPTLEVVLPISRHPAIAVSKPAKTVQTISTPKLRHASMTFAH